MRKFITLLAAMVVAIAANAQLISFTEPADKGTLDGKEFGTEGFLLQLTDNGVNDTGAANPKLAIDANNSYFGTIEEKQQFKFRLKTGGKSSSTNAMTLIIPADGTLKIYARTGSNSATDRNIVITQGETEVLNKILLESEAVAEPYTDSEGNEKTRNIYPVIECKVSKGTASVTYPINSVNIYGFELVAEKANDPVSYTADIVSDPENNYFSGYQAFDPAEIAAALGLEDAAALQAFIQDKEASHVYLQMGADKSNAYTGNHNEFWMGANGFAQNYSDEGTCWFVGLSYDDGVESGNPAEVDIVVGQMPNYFKKIYTDSNLSCVLTLENGDKVVTFNVNLKVNAATEPTLEEPVKELSKLEVVKSYTFPIEFVKGKQYEGKKFSTTLDGIYEALGCSAADIDEAVADYVYTPVAAISEEKCVIGDEEFNIYYVADEMKTPEEGAADAWFGLYKNKDVEADPDGNKEVTVINAPKAWDTGNNTFYTQNFALAEGEFSFVSGQFPGVLEMEQEYKADLYIINGSKAAKVTVVATLVLPEAIPFEKMTSAGSQDVEVSADIDNNYATKAFTIDIAQVCEALGCEAGDFEDIWAFAADGEASDNHTEGNKAPGQSGYYFNKEGYISEWGASSAAYITVGSLADGQFTVGQMPGTFTEITEDETVTFPFMYFYGDKYYTINLKYTVKAPSQKEEDFEYTLKATEILNKQIVPNSVGYNGTEKTTLDLEYISSVIGTTDFKLYADVLETDEEAGTSKLKWSSNYTCTPAPGFWYGTTEHEGVVTNDGWNGGNAGFGITYANGVITWYETPNVRQVGESYTGNLYLANEETGDYIKYVINVKYVEELAPEAESVGTEKSTVLVSDDCYDATAGTYKFEVPTADAFEALGLDDATFAASAEILANKTSATFEPIDFDESALVNANGYLVSVESEDLALGFYLTMEDGKTYLMVDDIMSNFDAEDATVKVRFAIEYDGKRYNYEFTLTNNPDVVSINGIAAKTAKADGKYMENGNIVIVRNGVKYNVAGAIVK